MALEEVRPNPEHFLTLIRQRQRGRLKVYLGFAAGVGKTFEMLQEGQRLHAQKVDVVPLVIIVRHQHRVVRRQAVRKVIRQPIHRQFRVEMLRHHPLQPLAQDRRYHRRTEEIDQPDQ